MTAPAALPADLAERVKAGTFLLVDKPRGPSSHQVTAWVRDLLGVERAGHAGTLDPNVSGLLWVGIGPALKLIPLVLEFPKRYVGVVAFHGPIRTADLDRVIAEFTGPVYQTPPVRSAVKRERRTRTIHRLKRLESTPQRAVLDVTADSGTYVRTIAVDLGDALGVGAHLEELRRIGTGPFLEGQSVSMTGLSDALVDARGGTSAAFESMLHPMSEVWKEFPVIRLKAAAASAVVHGANLAKGGIVDVSRPFQKGASVVLVGLSGELLAFGTANVSADEVPKSRHGWVVDAERVFADPAQYPPRWGTHAATKAPP
jgi:predicted rRNA pseudouridine synthase